MIQMNLPGKIELFRLWKTYVKKLNNPTNWTYWVNKQNMLVFWEIMNIYVLSFVPMFFLRRGVGVVADKK